MKFEMINEKQNAFLKRKELQVVLHHENEPTPSKAAIQELFSKHLNESAEKIDVRSIYSDRGRPRSLSKIFVWEEPPKKAEKKKEEKEEEPEAEKMKEKKKEEAKEEIKKEGK